MSNGTTDVFTVYNYIATHLVTGGIPIVSIILMTLYAKGYLNNKAIKRAEKEGKFEVKAYQFSPSSKFFNGVNKVLDWAIGGALTGLHKAAWKPAMKILANVLPDETIEPFMKATIGRNGIASLSFKSRVEQAEIEFDKQENAFWWNKERAPDFREISPIISGRWFNGKPVENYMPMFVAKENFYQVVRAGVLVFFLSLAVSGVAYRPDLTFGYTAERIALNQIASIVKNDEEWAGKSLTEDEKVNEAYAIVTSSGYTFIPRILFPLLFSFGVACLFIDRSYNNLFRKLKIPFIKDSFEEYTFEEKREEISVHKRNLSAANVRATGFDRTSPLIVLFESTGTFEERGMINARRKGQKMMVSLLDMSQNFQVFGATGASKTLQVLTPIAKAFFELKNRYYSLEQGYKEIFNLRTNTLTQKAIDEGYLQKYRSLPVNPISVAMLIMDVKSQLWKDMMPEAEKRHLKNEFQIIGANAAVGQIAVDLVASIDPEKFISFINSLESQMGGEMSNDFWKKSGLGTIKHFANFAYLYARTTGARAYMEKQNIKVWSPMFIQNLVVYDSSYDLFNQALAAIQADLERHPERLADVFTLERVRSIQYLLTDWRVMPTETKGGIQATMSVIMAGFENEKLAPFLTGVGDNIVEVGEAWGMLTAVDLDTDRYGNAGKFVQLFIKTLVFEEAVKRQMRFSTKVAQITHHFREEFKDTFEVVPAIELIPVTWLSKEAQDLVNKFHELCSIIQAVEGDWAYGEYTTKLQALAGQHQGDTDVESIYQVAREALELANQVYALEPRHAKEYVSMSGFSPSILNAVTTDTVEQTKRKEELMHEYYIYEDATTRIKREHMLFLGDEYQQLITVDTSGGCYSDSNFPNVSRSSNFKYCVASQTIAAYVDKVGKEVTDNFLNQMRSQIYLASEDQETGSTVESLAGKVNAISNPYKGKVLLDISVKTGLTIYNSFNSLISACIVQNKSGKNISPVYPYKHDIFCAAEPIAVDDTAIDFNGLVTSVFDNDYDFTFNSMKKHFLDHSSIPEYKRTGSNAESRGKDENVEAIRSAWAEAKNKADSMVEDVLSKNVSKDVPVYSATEFVSQGNTHAFVINQRGGTTVRDQTIISPKAFITN
jgi:hypothetical protein